MGTSVGDSESEAESLSEHVRRPHNQQDAAQQENDSSSDENNDQEDNYEQAQQDEEEASTESESEDEFMKDRQTTEDYSAYRERIFDFTPKGHKENKPLVEEIHDEEAPSTSGINLEVNINKEEEETEEDKEKPPKAFNFQLMAECMNQAIDTTLNETESTEETIETNEDRQIKEEIIDEITPTVDTIQETENILSTDQEVKILIEETDNDKYDEEEDSIEKPYLPDEQMHTEDTEEIYEKIEDSGEKEVTEDTPSVSQNTNAVECVEIDITKEKEDDGTDKQVNRQLEINEQLNSEEYELIEVSNLEETVLAAEDAEEFILENTEPLEESVNMPKEETFTELDQEEHMSDKKRNDIRLIQDTLSKIKNSDQSLSVLTFDEYLDKVEKDAEIAEASTSLEDIKKKKENVAGMTKNIAGDSLGDEKVKGNMTSATLLHIMRRNVIKCSSDSDDDDALPNEETEVSETLVQSELSASGHGDGPMTCGLSTVGNQTLEEDSKDIQSGDVLLTYDVKSEVTSLAAETIEDIEQVLNDSLKINQKVRKTRRHGGSEFKTAAMKENIKHLLTGWKQMNENLEALSSEESSDDEESDASTIDDEKPYYRKLDKSHPTDPITEEIDEECDSPKPVKSKEEIENELKKDLKDDQEDTSYREMLTWDLQVSDRIVQILGSRKRESNNPSEVCDMISQTAKKDKPEFEITPPKDIAEENDVIKYARRKPNIICNQNSSMYKPGRSWDDIPPHVQKTLRMSQSYPVFQKNQTEIIKTEVTTEKTSTPNTLTVCNKISDVRTQMAEFTKRLDDFKERSRIAREEVIKDYNDAVEKELKMVEDIMKTREQSLDELRARWVVKTDREPRQIDEEELKKHFEDMGIIVEEKDYTEKYLKTNINVFEEKEVQSKILDNSIDLEAERSELLDNISCEENMICESKTRFSTEEPVPLENETKETNEENSVEEDNTVVIDIDHFEECLTMNEEDEERTIPKKRLNLNYSEMADYLADPISDYAEENILEKSGESCEEYFTTNEEDSEEYDERTDVNYEELDNINIEEGFGYSQLVGMTMAPMYEEKDERREESFEDCHDKVKIEMEVDETGDNVERQVIRRNVTCSLEMQLAKKTD